jgi:monofunctional biosynthetic peptidoglycan transglycosylase
MAVKFFGAFLVLFVFYEALTWPDVGELAEQNPETTAFIERYRASERWSGREPRLEWQWAPYERLSRNLKRAAVVAEDANFFHHRGFDLEEMQKAIAKAREEREWPRGASTITQQLAKNLWLSPSYNPLRKLKEALLTIELERNLPKRRILELYLNVVEFGPGIFGAEAAARHYFNKPAAMLSDREAAMLAASLPRPRSWHPGVSSRGYRRRVNTILRRMSKAGYLGGER